jgi:diguanylate cyclase (GGDEF)-like protein/PAS domain S-box-containing protein
LPQSDWVERVMSPGRLDALKSTALLDTAPEEDFDRWTRLSSRLLGVPVALVSLVDDKRQFFKSQVGLGEPWATHRETPLSHSFCKHLVASGAPLVVSDARESPVLRDNLAIAELGAIAYAGVPLEANGVPIGAFCVIDNVPRDWTEDEVNLLRELADAVQTQIALRQANEAIRKREQMLERVLSLMPTGVLLRDVEGRVVRTNPALAKILGRTEEDLQTIDFWKITHPDDFAGDAAAREDLLRGGVDVTHRTKRYRHADGHWIWVRLAASVLRDRSNASLGTIAVIDDVTAEREEQQHLWRAKSLIEATIGNIRDGVVVLDPGWLVLFANKAYADFFGFDLEALPGTDRAYFLNHVSQLMQDPATFLQRIESPSPSAEGGSDEFVLVKPKRRVLRRSISPVELPSGPGHLVVWEDITLEKEMAAERDRQALTDALTGIANRRAAEHALLAELARADRAQTDVTVALFDIDHFKKINDQHGHAAGDEVIRRVASCLERAKRMTDVVARWGGEEFVAILPVRLEGAISFCERVLKLVENLQCGEVGRITFSAGMAEALDNESTGSLLERADRCLYAAKEGGRNQVQWEPGPPRSRVC